MVEIGGRPSWFRTRGLILVSNDVDDNFDEKDEGIDDVTHKAKLGDLVTMTVELPDGTPMEILAEVPAVAELNLGVWRWAVEGVRSDEQVDEAIRTIQEPFAQVALRVVATKHEVQTTVDKNFKPFVPHRVNKMSAARRRAGIL